MLLIGIPDVIPATVELQTGSPNTVSGKATSVGEHTGSPDVIPGHTLLLLLLLPPALLLPILVRELLELALLSEDNTRPILGLKLLLLDLLLLLLLLLLMLLLTNSQMSRLSLWKVVVRGSPAVMLPASKLRRAMGLPAVIPP